MRIGRTRYRVEWAHLAFSTAMAIVIVAYLLDVRAVSTNLMNTIFVQPVGLIAISIYLFIAFHCFRPETADLKVAGEADALDEEQGEGLPETLRVVGMMVALGLYACSLNLLGFDIATWLFALVAMFICGERSPRKLIFFPIILGFGVVYLFQYIIPFPMPMSII